MSSYHLLLSCSKLEKIWDIPKFHIRPYCHIWDCTSGLDSRMIAIESAFESSDTILFDQEKFSNIRTHPEELRVVKSKKCCYIHIISSKIYFSRRVVLRDEFLCYWIFLDRKVWCLSSQTHFQSRSFGYPNHLYNLIYGTKMWNSGISQIFSKLEQDNMRWYEDIRNGFEKLKPHTLRLWIT